MREGKEANSLPFRVYTNQLICADRFSDSAKRKEFCPDLVNTIISGAFLPEIQEFKKRFVVTLIIYLIFEA